MLPEAGAFELIFLAMVALIVVGPKDLPVLLRKVGQFTAKMRGLASEFRTSFDEMARQSELDELRREVEALRTGQFAAAALPDVQGHLGEIDAHLRDSPPASGPAPSHQGALPLPPPDAIPMSTPESRFTDDVEDEPPPPFDGPSGEEDYLAEAATRATAGAEHPLRASSPAPAPATSGQPHLPDDVEHHEPAPFDGPSGEEGYREEAVRPLAQAELAIPVTGAPAKARA